MTKAKLNYLNPVAMVKIISTEDVPSQTDQKFAPCKLSTQAVNIQEDNATLHHALCVYKKHCLGQIDLLKESSTKSEHDQMVMDYLTLQVNRTRKLQGHLITKIYNTKLIRWA